VTKTCGTFPHTDGADGRSSSSPLSIRAWVIIPRSRVAKASAILNGCRTVISRGGTALSYSLQACRPPGDLLRSRGGKQGLAGLAKLQENPARNLLKSEEIKSAKQAGFAKRLSYL
jgi:hypothetical protein